jgi:hypothetical protein
VKTFLTQAMFVVTTLCASSEVFASEPKIYCSPGFKLGYSFGENGGFVWGLELSVNSYFKRELFACIVFDIDFFEKWTRIHCGAEIMPFTVQYLCP